MALESTTESLTTHLLALSTTRPYSAATEHAFLHAAGTGTLPNQLLGIWLSQDRIYAAHAYPRFIGLLISKIPFSSQDRLDSKEEQRNRRLLKVLTYSLENVVREVGFFEEVAKEWNLEIEGWRERKGTRDYTAEMGRVASLGSLEEGLVFLWAMEQIYLDSWRYVASTLSKHSPSHSLTPTTTAISRLATNWTNSEFVQFVDELANIVNHDLGVKAGSETWRRTEEVWARVVELEEAFWPQKGEEGTMRVVA